MKYVFTVTQGRTGTASLLQFLLDNTPDGKPTFGIHEEAHPLLEGSGFPSIQTKAEYNWFAGFTEDVRQFWDRKWARVESICAQAAESYGQQPHAYIETSHLLSKAGLVEEVLDNASPEDEYIFVFLSRTPAEVMASMALRMDYHNVGDGWLWYLPPDAPYNILSPDEWMNTIGGNAAMIAWYYWEMQARMEILHELIQRSGKDNVRARWLDTSQTYSADFLLRELFNLEEVEEIQVPDRIANASGQEEVLQKLQANFASVGNLVNNPLGDQQDWGRFIEDVKMEWLQFKGTTMNHDDLINIHRSMHETQQ